MKTILPSLLVLLCTACAPNVRATPTTPIERGESTRLDGSATCEGSVARAGYRIPSSYCTAEVDYFCADALMKAGYPPSQLYQCRNVNGMCAASQINAGQPLTEIAVRCRWPNHAPRTL